MENIKIDIPKGYEIDKENSIINLKEGIIDIKFKEKVKRWRDNENVEVKGFYIDSNSEIKRLGYLDYNTPLNYNVFATEKQAKSALAMARISQIMANDERFGGIITDEEWMRKGTKYILEREEGKINKWVYCDTYQFLAFHTQEQRDLFLEENEDLVKQYFMID